METDQIKLLRQMQHLLLIQDEHANVGTGELVGELGDAAERLRLQLQPDVAALVRRLLAKDRLFLSPVARGNCSACGLRVLISAL